MPGKLQIPPLPEPQFPPLSRGPHRGRPCGNCRTRMQAPSSQERQQGGTWVSSTLCAWPGVGCLPFTTCPFPGFPGANPGSGFKSVTHPLGFWGSGLASGRLRPSWPGNPPPHLAWHLPSLGHRTPHPSLPLPEPVPPAVALHPQSLAGCCPQQAGQAGQGSRKTLGPESDTPAG